MIPRRLFPPFRGAAPSLLEHLLPAVGVLLSVWLAVALQGRRADVEDQLVLLAPFAVLALGGLLITSDPARWVFRVFPYTLMLRMDPMYWALEGLVLLLVVLDVVHSPSGRRLETFDRRLVGVVLAVGLLGILPSPDRGEALLRYLEIFIFPMGMYVAILRFPRGGDFVRDLIRHGVVAFAIIGLGSLYVKLSQPWVGRPGGFFNMYPTMIGQTAAAVLPFCYARLARAWSPRHLALLALVFLAMLLTNTRMAVLATGLGLLLYPELWKRLLLPALGFVVARRWMVELGFFTRLEQVTSGVEESVLARLVAWQEAVTLIKAHPWLGIGFSRFQHIYPSMTPVTFLRLMHAHNLWLNTSLELGIPGMLAFFGAIGTLLARGAWRLRAAWRVSRWAPERKALLVACVVFLSCGLVDTMFLSTSWTVLFWAWMAGIRRLEVEDAASPCAIEGSDSCTGAEADSGRNSWHHG